MGKADESDNSEDSDPAKSETTPEGGNGSEETPGEKEEEGQIPAEEPSGDNTDDSAEEPAEEVVEPTTDPEDPAVPEEPEDTEGTNTVNSTEVNADEETFTVSIDDFESVSAYITANATVDGNRDKGFAKTGALTAAKSAAVVVTISAKSGAKITSVKNGETPVSAVDGSYTITLSSLAADASITVEAAAAYKLTTELVSGVTAIKLDASLKEAAGAATDAALSVTTADIAQGDDLKFTLVSSGAGDDARYNVFYQANGSDERTAIDAAPESVDEGQSATKVDTYTVKKEDLADFHSIKIIVEKETKVDIETMLDTALADNSDVDVVYWGTRKSSVTTGEEAAWVEGATAGNYDAITKAYVGEEFKFKVVVKGNVTNKAVSKVTKTVGGREEAITAGTDGSYSITVPSDLTAFAIETDYTTAATNKLTYTLKDTCDKDSVTKVEITKIVAGATTASTAEDIKAYLGGKSPSAALTAGEAVSILKTSGEDEITTIEVTVTPKTDYTVVKGAADKHITVAADGSAVYKFTKTAGADSIAISAEMAVAVETDVKETAAANEKFFKVTRDKGTESDPKNTHIGDPVVTPVAEKVVAVPTSDTDTTPKAYKVLAGVKTVEFTVTADAGYTLKDYEDYAGFKSIKEEAAGEGKVKYTVTLFASKITGTTDSPDEIAVEEAGVLLSAEVKPSGAEEGADSFSVGTTEYTEKGEGKTPVAYTLGQEAIPYGSKLTTKITPAAGCHLVSVSYNMAGKDTPVTPNDDGAAEVTIPEVTAKVIINVTAEKDYEKTALTAASDYDTEPTEDENGVYSVRYDGKYLVGLTNGDEAVPAKNFKAVVKDEDGAEVTLPRIVIGTKLKIDLTRAKTNVAGQVITIDMVVGDKVVDTYILNVNKKTSKLTIEGAAKAEKEQRVDSVVKYAIDTDGKVDATVTLDEGSIINDYDIVGNNLVVTLNPMTTRQITKTAAVGTTPAVYHSATITLTSDDDPDLEASLVVTAQPFIDDITNKEITLEAGDQADTVLNAKLGLDGIAAPKSGELYYELTVTPKPATGTTLSDKLLSSVTVAPVDKRGSSQNVKIQVAKSGRLGEGAACDYEVKAKLTYDVDGGTTKESTKEMTSADFKTIDGKEIKYENNLKLTKDKSFKGTLYTGQSGEIVIADPKWSAKNVNYKILSGDIFDSVKYDNDGNELSTLEVGQNASGQIVVTDVPEDTYLGKHTITVEATADQTTGHEMYKSRATITVNVVKGIEDITITPASEQIYKKDARSKATLKMTAVLNDVDNIESSWDGKKYVSAPKSKSLKWELVGADSDEYSENPLPDSFGNKAVTINEKNGTVTVDKKFAVSPNKANNRFCVKATATDYAGNRTVDYSENIEITSKALGIAKIALVKDYYDDETAEYKYEVVAVQSSNNEEIKKRASEIDGATVYALPDGVELAKEYGTSEWSTVRRKLIDSSNYSVTSSGKKVVEVRNDNSLNVLTAGKKVKLTVTANDGSKQKRVVPLNLDWAGSEKDLALGIKFQDSATFDVFNPDTEYKTQKDKTAITVKPFTTTGAVRLSLQLMEGNKGEGTSTEFKNEADGFTNYKLTAKGGKLTSNGYGYASLVTTAKVTTLTLTIGSGREAKKSVYTITNKAYELTNKAPKITVKGSLHENGHKSEQQVTMVVKDGNSYYGKKAAKVEIDWSSMNAKNRDTLNWLNRSLASNVIQLDEKTGEMTLSFVDPDGSDWLGYTPGSYKLKVTVGTATASKFTPETLPATVTLKVVKNKTFTFKPQTTYTIGKLDGGAILTGKSNVAKGEKTFMNFYNLRNANVQGRPNDFTHYFTIEYDAINNTQRLVLNEDDPVFKEKFGITTQAPLNWETIDLTKIDKKDLTGYVSYDARANKKFYGIGTTGWSNSVEGTVKITVKLAANPKNNGAWKASLKYTTNKAEVLAKDNEKAVINVMSGNEYVTVGGAVLYETDNLKADSINEKGQVLIAVKGVEAKKSYSANMKIVPASSRFFGEVNALNVKGKEAEYKAAVEKYGIPVKVTVVAKATAAEVTATPDPVTVSAAVNIINAKDEATGWTTKLTAADLDNITTVEENTAKAALATEVGNYLKTLDPFKTGFTVTGNRVDHRVRYDKDGNPYVRVILTVAKGSDLEEIWLAISAEEGSVTPPASEKAPSDAVTLLGTHTGAWTDSNGAEIKVILSQDGSSVVTDNAATLATAVQTWINQQDGYTGFTVAPKTGVTVGTDGKVTLTISKDDAEEDVEITLATENQS